MTDPGFFTFWGEGAPELVSLSGSSAVALAATAKTVRDPSVLSRDVGNPRRISLSRDNYRETRVRQLIWVKNTGFVSATGGETRSGRMTVMDIEEAPQQGRNAFGRERVSAGKFSG